MREIKFRARSANIPRCWIYGYFVIEKGNCFIVNDDGKFQVIAGTQGQYTEKEDRNGKEIYEGDVVKYSIDGHEQSSPYVIENMVEWFEIMYDSDSYYRWDDIGEVIGNICENPELLKGA